MERGPTSHWNVVQLPIGMLYNFPLECCTTSHWNADNFVINSHPHIQVTDDSVH